MSAACCSHQCVCQVQKAMAASHVRPIWDGSGQTCTGHGLRRSRRAAPERSINDETRLYLRNLQLDLSVCSEDRPSWEEHGAMLHPKVDTAESSLCPLFAVADVMQK